jgi:hypothetical protein
LMFLLQLPLVSSQFDVFISATFGVKSVWCFYFSYLCCQASLMFLLQLPLVSIQFDVPSRINGLISATCSIKSVWRFVFRYLWCQVNLMFFNHKQNILINSTSFMLCLSHKYIPNIIFSSRKAYFWSHKAMIHVFNSSRFGFILKH